MKPLLLLYSLLLAAGLRQTQVETEQQRKVETIADKLLNHILSRKFHQNEYAHLVDSLSDLDDQLAVQNDLEEAQLINGTRHLAQLKKYYHYFTDQQDLTQKLTHYLEAIPKIDYASILKRLLNQMQQERSLLDHANSDRTQLEKSNQLYQEQVKQLNQQILFLQQHTNHTHKIKNTQEIPVSQPLPMEFPQAEQDHHYQFINSTRYKSALMIDDLDDQPTRPIDNSSFTVQQRLKAHLPQDDSSVNKPYSQSFHINIVSLTPLNDLTTIDNTTHHTNTPQNYSSFKTPKMIPEGSLALMQKHDELKKRQKEQIEEQERIEKEQQNMMGPPQLQTMGETEKQVNMRESLTEQVVEQREALQGQEQLVVQPQEYTTQPQGEQDDFATRVEEGE